MSNNNPLYELRFSEKDEMSGVEYISLIDIPYHTINAVSLFVRKPFIISQNQSDKTILFAAIRPNYPYRRIEADKEYYILFKPDTIKKVSGDFLNLDKCKKYRELHLSSGMFKVVESWVDAQGIWLVRIKAESQRAWESYLNQKTVPVLSMRYIFCFEQTTASSIVLLQLPEIHIL